MKAEALFYGDRRVLDDTGSAISTIQDPHFLHMSLLLFLGAASFWWLLNYRPRAARRVQGRQNQSATSSNESVAKRRVKKTRTVFVNPDGSRLRAEPNDNANGNDNFEKDTDKNPQGANIKIHGDKRGLATREEEYSTDEEVVEGIGANNAAVDDRPTILQNALKPFSTATPGCPR